MISNEWPYNNICISTLRLNEYSIGSRNCYHIYVKMLSLLSSKQSAAIQVTVRSSIILARTILFAYLDRRLLSKTFEFAGAGEKELVCLWRHVRLKSHIGSMFTNVRRKIPKVPSSYHMRNHRCEFAGKRHSPLYQTNWVERSWNIFLQMSTFAKLHQRIDFTIYSKNNS